ncbi:MurR/RpiR family transcriptional regulator [Ammoniphilus sp. YIM 78166]|uniref:MurR/RpiR family transcriptional regulator n=1 Tax=Ammoniphilus sp. YIM 78166 TaxID=1644106 RepID=UPI0010703E5F|nr:MurR/RpiR family transcriptional regulator [Ammoniphilus sp. YIM 78166]
MQNCLAYIRASFPSLSDKERIIANYIIDHPEKIIHLSINELAEETACAEATIFRLCKRLGFKGYQALKISLAKEVVHPIQDLHEAIQEGDSLPVIAHKVFTTNIEALRDTLDILDEATLSEAITLLVQARRIDLFGVGGSSSLILDAYHKFVRTGIPTFYHSDSHLQAIQASLLQKGDVVLGVSHSGVNKDILENLKIAKEAGAHIITITRYGKTPISQLADVSLFTASRETIFRSEALSSRLAQLCIIDALYVGMAMTRFDETMSNTEKIREAISQKRL